MSKKQLQNNEPLLLSRPQRNLKAKKIFDPSDNYIKKNTSKKKKTYLSKSEKPTDTSEKTTNNTKSKEDLSTGTSEKTTNDTKSKEDLMSKTHVKNEIFHNSYDKVFNEFPESSPSSSLVKNTCFICSIYPQKYESVDCRICATKVHKICLFDKEPVWKSKLDKCSWLCEECKKHFCSKCHMDETHWDIDCRCIQCQVGLHRVCLESYEIKPLHELAPENYICYPCLTLENKKRLKEEANQKRLKEEPNQKRLEGTDEEIIQPTDEDVDMKPVPNTGSHKDNIPDVTEWDKFQIHSYMAQKIPNAIAIKIIENDIDGQALQLLQRNDIVYNMGLKLGHAMKLYKQVRILQTRSTHPSVYWE